MDFVPRNEWTKERLFVEVCSLDLGQAGTDVHTSHRSLDVYQSSGKVGLKGPKAQKSAYHVFTHYRSIAQALMKFGIPCPDSPHAQGPAKDTSILYDGQPSNWPVSSPSLQMGYAYQSQFSHCVPQRDALGKVPYMDSSGEKHDAFERGSLIQDLRRHFRENPDAVYFRQNSPTANPNALPPLFGTSPVGADVRQASVQITKPNQAEHEAARVRRSSEALVGKTTLVIRNIPARFTQQEILKRVWVPDGTFDLLFLPHSFKLGHSVGYCFINFTSSAHAQAFHHRWHGQMLLGGSKAKPLDVHAARSQGIYDNMKYLSTSEVMRVKNSKFQPAVLQGTRTLDFMDALRALGLLG